MTLFEAAVAVAIISSVIAIVGALTSSTPEDGDDEQKKPTIKKSRVRTAGHQAHDANVFLREDLNTNAVRIKTRRFNKYYFYIVRIKKHFRKADYDDTSHPGKWIDVPPQTSWPWLINKYGNRLLFYGETQRTTEIDLGPLIIFRKIETRAKALLDEKEAPDNDDEHALSESADIVKFHIETKTQTPNGSKERNWHPDDSLGTAPNQQKRENVP